MNDRERERDEIALKAKSHNIMAQPAEIAINVNNLWLESIIVVGEENERARQKTPKFLLN